MGHIVNALGDHQYRHLIPALFEGSDEHQVTTIDDPWDLVALARSSLHGLIIMFNDDGRWYGVPDDLAQALPRQRQRQALHRHAFIHICWHQEFWPLSPPIQALYDELSVELVRVPSDKDLDNILAAVAHAAARLAECSA